MASVKVPIGKIKTVAPYIGANGNWFTTDGDTGIRAEGGTSDFNILTGQTFSVLKNITNIQNTESELHIFYHPDLDPSNIKEKVIKLPDRFLFNEYTNSFTGLKSATIGLVGVQVVYVDDSNSYRIDVSIKYGDGEIGIEPVDLGSSSGYGYIVDVCYLKMSNVIGAGSISTTTSVDYANTAGSAGTAGHAETAGVADRSIAQTLEYKIQEGVKLPYAQSAFYDAGLYFVTLTLPKEYTGKLVAFQVYIPYNINWTADTTICSNVVAVKLSDGWYRMSIEIQGGEISRLHHNNELSEVGGNIDMEDLTIIEISRIPLFSPDNLA